MTNENVSFCRLLLANLREELTPEQRKRLKGAWVYGYQRGAGDWEFQLPSENFYWNGHADNAYDARYQGISAWLRKNYPEPEQPSNDPLLACARLDNEDSGTEY